MAAQPLFPLPLPPRWSRHVRSAAVHAIALARMALATARAEEKSGDSNARRVARLEGQVVLLKKEEMRIKDGRMATIPAHRRPHYVPIDRLAILELRAARGWSQAQTAEHMQITPATVTAWTGRLNEEGPGALVQMTVPVNRFPEFVAYILKKLKILCPTRGNVRIANFLARSGLHLGSTTVARMLAERPRLSITRISSLLSVACSHVFFPCTRLPFRMSAEELGATLVGVLVFAADRLENRRSS